MKMSELVEWLVSEGLNNTEILLAIVEVADKIGEIEEGGGGQLDGITMPIYQSLKEVSRNIKNSDDEYDHDMSDVEADADTLASAGYGTDEDYGYGYFGGDEY